MAILLPIESPTISSEPPINHSTNFDGNLVHERFLMNIFAVVSAGRRFCRGVTIQILSDMQRTLDTHTLTHAPAKDTIFLYFFCFS